MMATIEKILQQAAMTAVEALFDAKVNEQQIQLQRTRKEFEGDFTLVVFPLLKIARKSPEQTAEAIGSYLEENVEEVSAYNVVKGFLNLSVSTSYWLSFFNKAYQQEQYGYAQQASGKRYMVEYSSPNTNKPLHLGHLRNNFLGYSVAEIFKANGHEVFKVQIINDRGIHICKSMVAWLKFGNGETPESAGIKGDHLVGKYYVAFDQQLKKEIAGPMAEGVEEKQAIFEAPIQTAAREMLKKWEASDPEVRALWAKMNGWVYDGFGKTYQTMGVDFDKLYYESDTFLIGKDKVLEHLDSDLLYQKEDGSVWIDLTADGLDNKLLLRSDGTSVYMTQDIGTAIIRHEEFNCEQYLYVVGNEQDYHFKVLALILQKMQYPWAKGIEHLSYGMVDLPSGKMKSREGTVVDADDLMQEMINTAEEISADLGKLDDLKDEERQQLFHTIGLGALKYFILKVDPKRKMLFDPKESVDFSGNTGPFIQYTYARIQSILRKAADFDFQFDQLDATKVLKEEQALIRQLYEFPQIVSEAGEARSPALIANYIYDLVKTYNYFYQNVPFLKEEDEHLRSFRIALSDLTAKVIKNGMRLLGINVPDQM